MGKMPPAIMIIFFIMELGISCSARNSTLGCIEQERNVLLRFRASLKDRSNRLSSWNPKNQDCCSWQGVKCNKFTGHVIRLDLGYKMLNDYFQLGIFLFPVGEGKRIRGNMLQGKTLDSSLFELKYLSYLDLSLNDFQGSKIPEFLGSMKHLYHLNLSHSNFRGVVPHHLGNLTSLRALDLSSGYYTNDIGRFPIETQNLIVNDLRWAINLSSLEYLDMSNVNLSFTKDPFKVLNMLPSLRILRLLSSDLSDAHLPHGCINSTMLANVWHLDLAGNSFHGGFPCFIQNMTTLRFLDLSYNMFNFSGTFHLSEFMSDKCHLKSLDLSSNNFDGNISGLFRNLSGCWSRNLESLSLRDNNLYGHIPTSLGSLRSLRVLDLSRNQLSGQIPILFEELSNLERIYISFNSFEGTFSEAHFAKLSKLEYLLAESTMLRFGVGYDWVPPFQLKCLSMGSSKIGGQFPKWLQTQKALTILDLSNCSIMGTLPKWLNSMNLTHVYLSHNNITGRIPKLASTMISLVLSNNMITHDLPNNIGHMMPRLYYLNLARNIINGTIPHSLCELRSLGRLDLSKNNLSGNLPDCWHNFQYLFVARLSLNELSGVIPISIGGAYQLKMLHLSDNKFTGQLPSTLKNCTELEVLNVGGNHLSGKLPEWMGNDLPKLVNVILGNNEFNGMIPPAFCQLVQLKILDLKNNKLTGNIPHCFNNLSNMIKLKMRYYPVYRTDSLRQVIKGMELEYTTNAEYLVNLDLSSNYLVGEIPSQLTALHSLIGLNLSHNNLSGEIPAKIGDLVALQSLDLSSNNLLGKIPDSLSNLNFLSHLNFSNNNLSGQIPTGHQLQTLIDPSIYEGNPQLCGAPLPKKCHNDKATKAPNIKNHEDPADKACFYAFLVAGFATGFWGLIGVLVVKTKWRQAYFRFIEVVANKMLGY